MGTADGAVLGSTQIVNNGSKAERFNLVLISEGYQAAQMAQFAADAQAFVTTLDGTSCSGQAAC